MPPTIYTHHKPLMLDNFAQVCVHKFKHKVELFFFQNELFNGDDIVVRQDFERLEIKYANKIGTLPKLSEFAGFIIVTSGCI